MLASAGFSSVPRAIVAVVLGLTCLPNLFSQTTTANLYGIVQDSTGASVPGASVTITHERTGQVITRSTDQLAEFSFSFLRVGTYSIDIQADGFKRYASSGLELSSGQQARLQLSLELGAITESVNVEGVTPQVNTVSAEQQQTIDNERVTDLPLARRNFSSLLNRDVTGQEFPVTDQQSREALSAEHIVAHRRGEGGPQPAEVNRMLAEHRKNLEDSKAWVVSEKKRISDAYAKLDQAFNALARN